MILFIRVSAGSGVILNLIIGNWGGSFVTVYVLVDSVVPFVRMIGLFAAVKTISHFVKSIELASSVRGISTVSIMFDGFEALMYIDFVKSRCTLQDSTCEVPVAVDEEVTTVVVGIWVMVFVPADPDGVVVHPVKMIRTSNTRETQIVVIRNVDIGMIEHSV